MSGSIQVRNQTSSMHYHLRNISSTVPYKKKSQFNPSNVEKHCTYFGQLPTSEWSRRQWRNPSSALPPVTQSTMNRLKRNRNAIYVIYIPPDFPKRRNKNKKHIFLFKKWIYTYGDWSGARPSRRKSLNRAKQPKAFYKKMKVLGVPPLFWLDHWT